MADHGDVIVSGTVENQWRFYDRLEHVVLLTAPARGADGAGRGPDEQFVRRLAADREEIARYVESVEPLLRRSATTKLDGRQSITALVDSVERLLTLR